MSERRGPEALAATLSQTALGDTAAADGGPLAPPAGERYQRGRELGRGGMGRVVEAVDRQFHRTVAIKELLDPRDPALRRRFVSEALITGNLEHPGIAPVHEVGEREDGTPYYVMRRVVGRTLAARLAEASTLADRLALLPAIVQTAHTLGYAHQRGVIHRDVKPDNVLVGEFGDVVLLDWGIARVRGVQAIAEPGGPSSAVATSYGSVVGTPLYMAPEQAAGETDRVDERSDVYALGALLYHVLTGRAPHTGATLDEVLASARRGQPAPVLEVERAAPPALAALCARAMARDPADRHASAVELAAELEALQARALLPSSGRALSIAIDALLALVLAGAGIGAAQMLRLMPSMRELGAGAYPLLALTLLGLGATVLDVATRGRHHLRGVALVLAALTFLGGVATAVTGTTLVFGALTEPAYADPATFQQTMAAGLYESLAGIAFGAVLCAVQLLAWAVVSRRRAR